MGNKAMSMPTANTENTTLMSLPNLENIPPPTPTPATLRYCDWKKSAEAGFYDNTKVYMSLFLHSSFDDHTTCFKANWNKMVARFKVKSAAVEGGETPEKN